MNERALVNPQPLIQLLRTTVLTNAQTTAGINEMPHSGIVAIDDPTWPSRQHEVNNIKYYGFSGRTGWLSAPALCVDTPIDARGFGLRIGPRSYRSSAIEMCVARQTPLRHALSMNLTPQTRYGA